MKALPAFAEWSQQHSVGMAPARAVPQAAENWFLLYVETVTGVRAELSHITGLNPDGTMKDWYTRLIIPIALPDAPDGTRATPVVSPDVEIALQRRVG